MKILHFAVENFARVPANLVHAERALGHESLLVTLYTSAHGFRDEDVCLDAPFVKIPAADALRRAVRSRSAASGGARLRPGQGPPVWKPANRVAGWLVRARDRIWEPRVRRLLASIRIESFDALVLDGGLGFLRNDPFVPALKAAGMKLAVGYYGSDFRTRGILPAIDSLADYRFTMEFDHTLLDPTLDFLLYPFVLPAFQRLEAARTGRVRVGHSPTNRAVKGTDAILSQLSRLGEKYPVETVLIENLPQAEALALKATCDLLVDALGELGYGVSGVEAMAMGIPTAAELLPDFERVLGAHPLINV